MKSFRWVVLALGVGLIVVNGFFPDVFKINAFTILILFILSIPIVASYLKKAKFPGAEFVFKDEIQKAEGLVQKSVEQAEKAENAGKKKILPFETFKLSAVKEQLESDHVLALAALRIEIEKKLMSVADFLDIPAKEKRKLPQIINYLQRKDILFQEQIAALEKINNMCTHAIHGVSVSYKEAKKIVDLADELNMSFSTGYSINFFPNEDYEKQGLFCEWEHCIEWLPLTEEDTELSCPVWGHNCPGGIEKTSKCGKAIEDFPHERSMTEGQFVDFLKSIKKK